MKKDFINGMWVCFKDSGEKGKFRNEKDADLFLGVKEAPPIIIFEDDSEDDNTPDEAQQWDDDETDA